MFAVPGTMMGFFVMLLILSGIQVLAFQVAGIALIPTVDYFTIMIAVSLGILLPLLANAAPINKAVSKQLRDALDTNRKSLDNITVQMQKLKEFGIEPK
jgi:hypothetical protein